MITPNIIIYSLCFIRLRYYKENFEADHSRVPLMNSLFHSFVLKSEEFQCYRVAFLQPKII